MSTQMIKKEENKIKEPKIFTLTPAVDIYETKESTILVLDIPGVEEGSVDVSIEKDILTVSGKSKLQINEKYKPTYSEFRIGDYQRKFTINRTIDVQKSSAIVKNGRLKLTLPKLESTTKKIQVKSE